MSSMLILSDFPTCKFSMLFFFLQKYNGKYKI